MTFPQGSKENSSSSTAAPAASSSQQPENNEVFVQTITRFLQELKTDPTDPDSSTNTSDWKPISLLQEKLLFYKLGVQMIYIYHLLQPSTYL